MYIIIIIIFARLLTFHIFARYMGTNEAKQKAQTRTKFNIDIKVHFRQAVAILDSFCRVSTMYTNDLLQSQRGFEPVFSRSRVRCLHHWATPKTSTHCTDEHDHFSVIGAPCVTYRQCHVRDIYK